LDTTESLGKYLKKERESRNLSLKQVSQKTRISEHVLTSIEEDRHDLLPAATYVKGFLSAYARFLGMDPNDVLSRYPNRFEGKGISRSETPAPKKIQSKTRYGRVLSGILVILLIAFILFYFKLPFPTPPVQPPPPKPMASPETEEPSPVSPPQTAAPVSSEEEVPFTLQIKAVEETWVRIQINGEPDQEMTLKPGERTSHRASERIQLRIGNAGGLDLIFNGKTLEKFGKTGEVVTLTFTPEGVEAQSHEKPEPDSE
jgi:cytoskeletal protein RodZ